ncbi:MAG: hydrogenase formation protein HypD [Alphaproteobacteria bacterium]|nr:hydrogenase formation protein HypD [Alphaproteobacteria bacterium]MCB9696925.1 hydrogenase formation protein HypD [Alphaproteobacteria bacterium]
MRYVDEFRDPVAARKLVAAIEGQAARLDRRVRIMEVCGGHTHTIFKFGLEEMLPDGIELVHGPGCPVCVLPVGRVDDAVAIALQPGVIFATFGDAVRVPGSQGSLARAKASGADVRTVYSPVDALQLARENPGHQVVFFALGFETTAPSTALAVLQAEREGLGNFTVFSNHVTIVPALEALLEAPEQRIDGFVGPGHVTMIIGLAPYAFIAERHRRPLVVSGFEPLDVLQSVSMVLAQLLDGRAEIENQYRRGVKDEGNRAAQDAIGRVFELRPSFEWRGLGSIERSGLRLTEAYARFDAERRFAVPHHSVADPAACRCGDVLKGVIQPWQCGVFGTACTPHSPIGACMVSSEGACAAYYGYGRLSTARRLEGSR